MFDAFGEGRGEGVRIHDASSSLPTPVELLTLPETVNPGRAFRRVELGGIFEESHAPLVHFFGDPAFVADVGVAAALVEGSKDPLHLRRTVSRAGQPWPGVLAAVEVSHRVADGDVRQARASGLEPVERFGRLIACHRIAGGIGGTARLGGTVPDGTERTLLPPGNGPLLQVGGVLGPATQLGSNAGDRCVGSLRAGPFGSSVPIAAIRVVHAATKFAHRASITGRADRTTLREAGARRHQPDASRDQETTPQLAWGGPVSLIRVPDTTGGERSSF
jgi:hypothetical protein